MMKNYKILWKPHWICSDEIHQHWVVRQSITATCRAHSSIATVREGHLQEEKCFWPSYTLKLCSNIMSRAATEDNPVSDKNTWAATAFKFAAANLPRLFA